MDGNIVNRPRMEEEAYARIYLRQKQLKQYIVLNVRILFNFFEPLRIHYQSIDASISFTMLKS